MTDVSPLTLQSFNFDMRVAMPQFEMDITTGMRLDNPMFDDAQPSTVKLEGTAMGQPVQQAFTAAQSPEEQAALKGVYDSLLAVDFLADAQPLAPDAPLAENSGRLSFVDPRTGTMDKPVQTLAIDANVLEQPKYEAFATALQSYATIAFPEAYSPDETAAVA